MVCAPSVTFRIRDYFFSASERVRLAVTSVSASVDTFRPPSSPAYWQDLRYAAAAAEIQYPAVAGLQICIDATKASGTKMPDFPLKSAYIISLKRYPQITMPSSRLSVICNTCAPVQHTPITLYPFSRQKVTDIFRIFQLWKYNYYVYHCNPSSSCTILKKIKIHLGRKNLYAVKILIQFPIRKPGGNILPILSFSP